MEAAINGGLKLYWVIAVVLAEKEKSGVGGGNLNVAWNVTLLVHLRVALH